MIQFKNFDFYYSEKKPLLSDINFDLEKGKVYGLFGKNGTGKTTLLKAMCGLVFAKGGEVTLNGVLPSKRTPSFLNTIYYVPDEFTLPKLSIKQYVKLYSIYYPNFSFTEFESYLVKFEIPVKGKPYEFSLGQQKKFLIAFALACNTAYLLLDEPTNGLDIPSKNQFRKIIASTISDEKTIIISTHQSRDLENLLDHILILDKTSLVLNSSVTEIVKKIKFTKYTQEPDPEFCLGVLEVMGGYAVVEKNEDKEFTQMDLEQLMNAVLEHPKKFKEIFKNEK
ncbi:ABC transporter ATP-binding protein [Wenyingzhuangia sp. IMCC45574]